MLPVKQTNSIVLTDFSVFRKSMNAIIRILCRNVSVCIQYINLEIFLFIRIYIHRVFSVFVVECIILYLFIYTFLWFILTLGVTANFSALNVEFIQISHFSHDSCVCRYLKKNVKFFYKYKHKFVEINNIINQEQRKRKIIDNWR